MANSDSPLWYSLELDPGTAAFFGIPDTLSLPASGDSPFLGGDDTQTSLPLLARALEEARDQHPDQMADPDLLRFLGRWPRYMDLDRYLKMGNATFAERVADSLLADDPSDPPPLAALALLLVNSEKWSEARKKLELALERAPDYVPLRFQYALTLAGAGETEDALAHLHPLTKRSRVQSLARLWSYEIKKSLGKTLKPQIKGALQWVTDREAGPETGAVSEWEKLKTAFPQNPEVLYTQAMRPDTEFPESERETLLARCLESAPDHLPAAAGLAQLLRMNGKGESALDVVEHTLARHPHEDALLAAKGQVLEQLGRRDEALAAYRTLFEKTLSHLHPSSLLIAGSGITRLGSSAEARTLLTDTLEARPGDPLPHQLLARLDEAEADPARAERRLRDGIKSCGPLPILQYALGDLLRRQGRRVEAEGLFKVLVRRHPKSHWGHQGLGNMVVEEKPAEATEHFARALRINPTLSIAGYDYLRGVASLRAGKSDDARRWLERAVATEPDNARYWGDLGAAHFYEGGLEKAILATQRALALEPGHPGFLHNLAAYHDARFSRHPLRHFESKWKAWQLRRKVRGADREGWRRDLWHAGKESSSEAPPRDE